MSQINRILQLATTVSVMTIPVHGMKHSVKETKTVVHQMSSEQKKNYTNAVQELVKIIEGKPEGIFGMISFENKIDTILKNKTDYTIDTPLKDGKNALLLAIEANATHLINYLVQNSKADVSVALILIIESALQARQFIEIVEKANNSHELNPKTIEDLLSSTKPTELTKLMEALTNALTSEQLTPKMIEKTFISEKTMALFVEDIKNKKLTQEKLTEYIDLKKLKYVIEQALESKQLNWTLINVLLKHGASLVTKDGDEKTALNLLASYPKDQNELLASKKHQEGCKSGEYQTLLNYILGKNDDEKKFKEFFRLKLDGTVSDFSKTVSNEQFLDIINIAIKHCSSNIVKCLVSPGGLGEYVNLVDPGTGYSPLHIACRSYKTDTVAMLLGLGANMNLKNKSGQTPLQVSCDSLTTTTSEIMELARKLDTTDSSYDHKKKAYSERISKLPHNQDQIIFTFANHTAQQKELSLTKDEMNNGINCKIATVVAKKYNFPETAILLLQRKAIENGDFLK